MSVGGCCIPGWTVRLLDGGGMGLLKRGFLWTDFFKTGCFENFDWIEPGGWRLDRR